MDGPPRTPAAPPPDGPARGPEAPTPWLASPRHLRWLVAVGLAALVLVVVALVVSIHESDTMGSMATIQTAGFSRPPRMTPVPFSLPVLQPGAAAPAHETGSVSMASLRGRPLVLNMWGSYCTVCRRETPAVEAVARRVGAAVRFVGVDTADQRGTALRFLRRYRVTYLQLFDPGERVASGYGVQGLPVTVFVSGSGSVVGEYLGALDAKTLTHYLGTLFGVRVPPLAKRSDISTTVTKTGQRVDAHVVEADHPTGIKISGKEMKALSIRHHDIQPDRDWTISPE